MAAQAADLQKLTAVFVMEPGLVVQGKITDDKGKPVPAAQVKLSPHSFVLGGPSPTRAETVTDHAGRYRFANCAPDGNTIIVLARGRTSQHKDITIAAGMASVDFRLSPGKPVKIRVVDAQGKPLGGAKIQPDNAAFFSENQLYVADAMETDRDGRWASANSPQGELLLQIGRPGYATAHRHLSASTKEHLVTLRPPVCISGRVIDAVTKKPLRKVHISAAYIASQGEQVSLTYPNVGVTARGDTA